jgi:menaquinone-dependent protoporphyrinogen IX oxidase
MKNVWILTESRFGNGKNLAETLKRQFPEGFNINVGDVKDLSPEKVVEEEPDILIQGGAIRMFRGAPKSKKFLKKLNKVLEQNNHTIQYGTGFLTHGLPTDKVQGFAKRYLKKIKKASMIEKTYPNLLTARVKEQEGPILDDEMEKAKKYIQEFIQWIE